jgi:cation diffusion facilitator CzcD-associated flavoprotein CzcO
MGMIGSLLCVIGGGILGVLAARATREYEITHWRVRYENQRRIAEGWRSFAERQRDTEKTV